MESTNDDTFEFLTYIDKYGIMRYVVNNAPVTDY